MYRPKTEHVLVTGAGGFIGHHLVAELKRRKCRVRGVDLKGPQFEDSRADEFLIGDLRDPDVADEVCRGMDTVFALAADMGGMGFISHHHADIMTNNALINLNTIRAARLHQVKRYFFASSACVYPEYRQLDPENAGLSEGDAYPAQPQDAYGWEKLFTERLVMHYGEEHGLDVSIARFHNIYGPLGTWTGGREKAPAAICRKVARAKLLGELSIEIWGDGHQTRSFLHVNDVVPGIIALATSGHHQPVNLGSDRLISINDLVLLVSQIAQYPVEITHIDGPVGVRGRNSDNRLALELLPWSPRISLEQGLEDTYVWIEAQVQEASR